VLETILQPYHAVTELVRGGGPFVIFIFLNGVILWTLTIERAWYFTRILPREIKETVSKWDARVDHLSWCARSIRIGMISRLDSAMTANMPLLRVLVPLGPLLGLIGTVSGMLEVFDSMSLRGSADARTMASGISHAMICTMSGLAVSITGLPGVTYFSTRAKHMREEIADQLKF
jgi:biopolymer transport protein ExbB